MNKNIRHSYNIHEENSFTNIMNIINSVQIEKRIRLNALAKLILGFRTRYFNDLLSLNRMKCYDIPEYDFMLRLKRIILYVLEQEPQLQDVFNKLDTLRITYNLYL